MEPIRIVWGTGIAPTKQASYDIALADAGICNYNLITVSSVIPADVDVCPVGTAPDLGSPGNRLTVVQARETARGETQVSAALAWAQSAHRGPGLFYETADTADPKTVKKRALEGLSIGTSLREWDFSETEVEKHERPRDMIDSSADTLNQLEVNANDRNTNSVPSGVHVECKTGSRDSYVTALVIGIYGESKPIL